MKQSSRSSSEKQLFWIRFTQGLQLLFWTAAFVYESLEYGLVGFATWFLSLCLFLCIRYIWKSKPTY